MTINDDHDKIRSICKTGGVVSMIVMMIMVIMLIVLMLMMTRLDPFGQSGDRPISFDRGPSHLVKILNPQTDHQEDDDVMCMVLMVTSG